MFSQVTNQTCECISNLTDVCDMSHTPLFYRYVCGETSDKGWIVLQLWGYA